MKWILIVVFFLLGGLFLLKPSWTGNTLSYPSQPGNITIMNISEGNPYWHGYRGELENFGGNQFNATGNTVENISVHIPCDPSLISLVFFSTTPLTDTVNLTNISRSDIDTFLGVSSNVWSSGTNTFNETKEFDLFGNTIRAFSLRTKATHALFHTGVFALPNGSLVFAATVANDQPDFALETSDFQVILPLNGTPTPYYLFIDPDDCISENIVPDEQTKKPRPYLFPGRRNDTDEPPIITFSGDEYEPPAIPEITPQEPLPQPPITVESTGTWNNGYVLDLKIHGLQEDIESVVIILDGDAKNFFRSRSDKANFFLDDITKIYIDPLADLPPGRYSGLLLLRHYSFGELSIPFVIEIPQKVGFSISWIIALLIVLAIMTHLLFRKYHKKKLDKIDSRLEIMRKQLDAVKKMKK